MGIGIYLSIVVEYPFFWHLIFFGLFTPFWSCIFPSVFWTGRLHVHLVCFDSTNREFISLLKVHSLNRLILPASFGQLTIYLSVESNWPPTGR